MDVDQMNELAGRIEAVGRSVMHLVARLEDAGVIDGVGYAEGLRCSVVIKPDSSVLMRSAKAALERSADALDEARQWRRFRQAVTPGKQSRA